MTYHVQWSQIEAECDGYREGFVKIYRKYEDMPTDEKDAQGRAIKVTVSTFARHAGIPEETFRRWVKRAGQERRGGDAGRDRTRESINRMPAADKAKLAAELLEDEAVEVPPAVIARQASRPDVARAIARNDEAREAVEEEAIDHRARFSDTERDERMERAPRQAAAGMARALKTDLATSSLRQAAGLIAEAVFEREEFGIQHPDDERDALDRVHRALTAYQAGTVSEDERGWLESIGVQA